MIREAVAADVPQIVALLHDDPQGARRESLSPEVLPRYQAAFARITNDPQAVLLVAEMDGAVVGCLQMNMLAGLSYQGITRALIEDVRVATLYRGRGLGRQLMDAATALAKARGCGLVELFVHNERADAHAFYEACGFEGQHRGYRRRLDTPD